ncbi:MAG: group III truncated hemoglobin [Roseiarcus sp.]
MTRVETAVPIALKAPAEPEWPLADDAAPALAGFVFSAADAPRAAGVFALALAVDGRLYPLVIGEAADLAEALERARAKLPPLPGAARGVWLERAAPRQRAHIARDLIRKLNPPLVAEGRSGRAPDAIAAFVPDLAAAEFPTVEPEDAEVSEAALATFVHAFYAAARADAAIGPIFARAVADWDAHERTVRDFWSKTLVGSARYSGFPYTAHVGLGLAPEHFDRWLEILASVAARTLPAPAARRAVAKATQMSRCFQSGLMPVNSEAPAPRAS